MESGVRMRGWAVPTLLAALGVLAARDLVAQEAGGRFYGDRILRCESRGAQANVCPADVSEGVRILRELRGAECEEGDTWGVVDTGVWVKGGCRADFLIGHGGSDAGRGAVRLVRCESRGSRWQHCQADTSAGLELVRQLSKNPCIYGQNWGADVRGVWVSGGCRAEFRMKADVAAAAKRPDGLIVRCDSKDKRPRHCPADTRHGVRLYKQLSRAACVQGRSWGFDGNGIWVENGCRAEFEIGFRSQSDG